MHTLHQPVAIVPFNSYAICLFKCDFRSWQQSHADDNVQCDGQTLACSGIVCVIVYNESERMLDVRQRCRELLTPFAQPTSHCVPGM